MKIGYFYLAICVIVAVFGGLIMTAIGLYDLIVNFKVLTAKEMFWDIILILGRDLFVGILCLFFYILGINKLKNG